MNIWYHTDVSVLLYSCDNLDSEEVGIILYSGGGRSRDIIAFSSQITETRWRSQPIKARWWCSESASSLVYEKTTGDSYTSTNTHRCRQDRWNLSSFHQTNQFPKHSPEMQSTKQNPQVQSQRTESQNQYPEIHRESESGPKPELKARIIKIALTEPNLRFSLLGETGRFRLPGSQSG